MMKTEFMRPPPKRRSIDPRRKQFAPEPVWKPQDYKHRLNFYDVPPTADITLEEFEEWAIHRLKVLAELENCTFRNKNPEETEQYMLPLMEKYMPLSQNTSKNASRAEERKKDHYSHYILRLAFSATEDLRRRFSRLETQLFKLRFQNNDMRDRTDFVKGLNIEWEEVSSEERQQYASELDAVLKNTYGWRGARKDDEDGWFKVDWEKVPELVETRKVFVRRGMAYVPQREQMSLILSEYTRRLDSALELTARALPRLDEDDRLSPILAHLSSNFSAPGSSYTGSDAALPGAPVNASNIDALSTHFPLCMRNLHTTLRANGHLKHFGRLQYTLFLKGIGLSLEDSLSFWRASFRGITDDTFNKEYRYNVRHAYGDVGGDANRRGRGYTPYSCQKLLTEPLPGPGQAHGCPYRTYTVDNLTGLLRGMGVGDSDVLRSVKDDVSRQRYHVACNRVFEWAHKSELKKVKEEGLWKGEDLDTIVHPNAYFKRSYLLKNLGKGVKDEDSDQARMQVEIDKA